MAISSMPETDPRVSRLLADIDGLALDDHHWLVIRSIHEHFGHFNSMPISKS
ncbi:MAG: DsrC like protein [Nitrospirae bacterium]|nr:DsrC like protein [Nitrospirota bacterium]